MQLSWSILYGLSLATLSVANQDCTDKISTSQGFVQGHNALNKSSVCEYLGIPYAAPPTGDLRFAPPIKPGNTSLYIAANQGADCPQTTSSIFAYPNATTQYDRIVTAFANSQSNHTQSEDCLTLNIWSMANSTQTGKPVIVFFYGGSELSKADVMKGLVDSVQDMPLVAPTLHSMTDNSLPTLKTSLL